VFLCFKDKTNDTITIAIGRSLSSDNNCCILGKPIDIDAENDDEIIEQTKLDSKEASLLTVDYCKNYGQ
jgi:hypothetical protein